MDSKIISAIPDIFSVFGGKTLRLLYRGSRHGFGASAFHNLCDGCPNTVTLILSTNGSIFGGYSPIAWKSGGGLVADPSFASFILTLRNPHNLPARIFKQKEAKKGILCSQTCGPAFSGSCDLLVCDQCHGSRGG
jgi:hypothetical protein